MIDDLKYTITEGSNVSVGLVEDRYDINGTLTIPSKIANKGVGYTVTSIAGSVRVIGDHAFSDSHLRDIGFPGEHQGLRVQGDIPSELQAVSSRRPNAEPYPRIHPYRGDCTRSSSIYPF